MIDLSMSALIMDPFNSIISGLGLKCKFLVYCPISAPGGIWGCAYESAGDYRGYAERADAIVAAGSENAEKMSDQVSLTGNIAVVMRGIRSCWLQELMKSEDLIHVPGFCPTCSAQNTCF